MFHHGRQIPKVWSPEEKEEQQQGGAETGSLRHTDTSGLIPNLWCLGSGPPYADADYELSQHWWGC